MARESIPVPARVAHEIADGLREKNLLNARALENLPLVIDVVRPSIEERLIMRALAMASGGRSRWVTYLAPVYAITPMLLVAAGIAIFVFVVLANLP